MRPNLAEALAVIWGWSTLNLPKIARTDFSQKGKAGDSALRFIEGRGKTLREGLINGRA